MSRGANAPPPSAAACPPRRLAGDTQADAEFGQGKLPTPTHSPTFAARSRDRSPHRRKSRPPPTPFISSRSRSQIRSVPRAAALHPSFHPMSQMDNSSSFPSLPPLSSPLLSLGMFSCAHVRANYFSISRVFDCSRQSSTSSSVDRPSKHDTFPLPHPPTDRPTRPRPEAGWLAPVAAATIIFVLIWEEKSRGRKRRTEESSGGGHGGPRTCDPPSSIEHGTSSPLLRWR